MNGEYSVNPMLNLLLGITIGWAVEIRMIWLMTARIIFMGMKMNDEWIGEVYIKV